MLRLQQKIIYTIYDLSEDEIDLFNFRTECYPKKNRKMFYRNLENETKRLANALCSQCRNVILKMD